MFNTKIGGVRGKACVCAWLGPQTSICNSQKHQALDGFWMKETLSLSNWAFKVITPFWKFSYKANIWLSLSADTFKNSSLPFSLCHFTFPSCYQENLSTIKQQSSAQEALWKCVCLWVHIQRAEETQHMQLPRHLSGILHLLLHAIRHKANGFYEDPLRTISFCFPEPAFLSWFVQMSKWITSKSEKMEIQESQPNALSNYI